MGGGGAVPGSTRERLVGWWTPGPEGTHDARRRRNDRVFGTVLVVVWGVWLVLTFFTQARLVTPDRLAADLVAGRVTTFDVGVLGPRDDGPSWSRGPQLERIGRPPGGEDPDLAGSGEAVLYRVSGPFAPLRIVDPSLGALDVPALERQLEAAGVPRLTQQQTLVAVVDGTQQWPQAPAALLVFLVLASVLIGPRPTRGTRWFWFWMLFVPFGLGVLAYGVWEQLRPRTSGVPPPRGRWLTGPRGFLVLVFAVPLVLAAVHIVLDTTHWFWLIRP